MSRGPLLSCVGLTFVLGAGASCEWWACVGLEAARGPGRPRFVLGGLEAYVGHRTRVQPHDKLGTPVYGRASWRSSNPLTESADRTRRQQDQ